MVGNRLPLFAEEKYIKVLEGKLRMLLYKDTLKNTKSN